MVATATVTTWSKVARMSPAENRTRAVWEKSTVNATVVSSPVTGGSLMVVAQLSLIAAAYGIPDGHFPILPGAATRRAVLAAEK